LANLSCSRVLSSSGGRDISFSEESFWWQTNNVQVSEITTANSQAPFLPIQDNDSMLTVLLLLSKFRLRSIPVVNIDENVVQNVITEAGVILGLSQCHGRDWFDNLAGKSLHQLGLPVMMRSKEITRYPSHSF